jgi:hypothetical protein
MSDSRGYRQATYFSFIVVSVLGDLSLYMYLLLTTLHTISNLIGDYGPFHVHT